MVELVNYGSLVGIFSGAFLIWVSGWMGKEFDERSVSGEKVGEESSASLAAMGAAQNKVDDTSCMADGSEKKAEVNVV
jgi:hypothetical protein